MGKDNKPRKQHLKFISYADFLLWDVKRYFFTDIKSNYEIVCLSSLIDERSEKKKLFNYPEEEFGILGVNNKIGVFDSYKEFGENINQSYKKVYINDLTYNPYRINVGSIGLRTEEHQYDFISPAYIVFRCKERLLPEFLYKVFKTSVFNKVIKDNTTGSVRQNLKFDSLSNIKIPLPSMGVQVNIVGLHNKKIKYAEFKGREAEDIEKKILIYVDDALGIKKKDKPLGNGLMKFVSYRLLNKWGVGKQDLAGIIFSKDYLVKKISDICSVGSGGTPSRGRKGFYSGDIPWVKTGEVINEVIYDTEEKITKDAISSSSAKVYPKGSLIIAMYGQGKTRGRTAKLGVLATTNQACAVLSDIDNTIINTDYLWFYLMNEYDRLRELASGNSQPNLNAQMIKDYKVIIPPLDIQNQIVESIIKMKSEVKCLQQQAKESRDIAIKEFEKDVFQ